MATLERAPEPSAVVWDAGRAGGAASDRAAAQAAAQKAAASAARRGGLVQGAVGFAVALALGLLWRPVAGYVVASVTALLTVLALAFPLTAHAQVQRGLRIFARAVGLAVTWVLMTLLYFLVFLPVGLVLRLGGKLGITTRPDRRLASYWKVTDPARRTPASYRKQF
jgi:hypothetical protein